MAKSTLILVALLGAIATFAKPLPFYTYKLPTEKVSSRDAFINATFTPMLFMQALLADSIQHPEIIYAQAMLESANFQSQLFKQGHNAMGMKKAERRPTTAIGTCLKHARYRHWYDQVKDIKLWQTYFLKGKQLTTEQYIAKLKTYATDPHYLAKVRKRLPQSREVLREASL